MNGGGLSEPTLRRLAELEAKESLESYNRGELRAMTHSRPTAEESQRIDRLLSAATEGATEPSAAYERGLQMGRDSYRHG